jgi:hypothetical protein
MRRHPVLLVLLLLLAAAGCSGDDGGSASTTTAAATPSTPSVTTPDSLPATDVTALVYFTRDGKVATAGRAVEPPAVARGALEALLAGPDELESSLGMEGAFPDGTRLIDVTVADGVATVDLSGELLNDVDGPIALRIAQVVFTLTQFPTVDRVTITIAGASSPTVGLDQVPVVEVDRSDFEEQIPAILVEQPTPGAAVTSPIEVTGLSNTFEANVLYEVTGPDGAVLDDGFTTATSGTGTWGTFSLTTDVDPGDVTLTVFQESAEDGSRTDLYAVPVHVG